MCVKLAHMIVQDGEGATKLLEVRIHEANNSVEARQIARSIINSPLVKTALYGENPNWGRFIMASRQNSFRQS